jgi:predicted PurR-regulated permease PerM
MLLLIYLSLLIAITLTKLERFLMGHGWRKLYADIFLIVCLLVVLSEVLFVLIPTAVTQMEEVAQHIPELKEQLMKMTSPTIREGAGKIMKGTSGTENRIWSQFATIANNTLTGMFKFGLMMIVSFYMLMEGPKAYAWILAFFSPPTRKRIDETAKEIGPIVESYIVGQAITSSLAALWVFTTASILGVPAALTLAVLAAVFDILPSLGFILNAITCGILSLTISPQTALIFLGSLTVYTLLESYLLIPYIYGSKMKLSPLVVLLSLIMAGTLAGIPGMIGVLPLVASFGPIERHWLRRRVELKETAVIHERLQGRTSEDIANHRMKN